MLEHRHIFNPRRALKDRSVHKNLQVILKVASSVSKLQETCTLHLVLCTTTLLGEKDTVSPLNSVPALRELPFLKL